MAKTPPDGPIISNLGAPTPLQIPAEREQLEIEKLKEEISNLRTKEKEALELEKLKEEIAALRLPWWKKPVYIAAIFPTVLGIIAVLAAFATGAVKAQYDLVQYQKQKTDDQKAQIETDRTAIAKDQQELNEQKKRLEADKQKMTMEIAELKKGQVVGKIITHLDAIEAEGDNLWALHDSVGSIIKLLKNDPDNVFQPEVATRLNHTTNIVVKSHLLMMLYLGTGNQSWREKLWQITCQAPESKPSRCWSVFGTSAPWSDADGITIVELLTGIISTNASLAINQRSEIQAALERRLPYGAGQELRSKFSNNDVFFEAIKNARNLLVDTNAPYYYRLPGLEVLSKLAPPVCIAGAAIVLRGHETNLNMIARVNDALKDDGSAVKEFAKSLNCPTSVDAVEWQKWSEANKQLVDEAGEPNLDSWRKDPVKFDKLRDH